MFCEKLFTFHSFPCQALPTGCAGQQREIKNMSRNLLSVHPILEIISFPAEIGRHDVGVPRHFRSRSFHNDFSRFHDISIVSNLQCFSCILFYKKNRCPHFIDILDDIKICWTTRGASPMDGSSRSMSCGLAIMARAMASICCSPPERVPPNCFPFPAAGENAGRLSPYLP